MSARAAGTDAALEAATALHARQGPPVEIVRRVEALIAAVRSDPRVGAEEAHDDAVLAELDAIAARVRATWAPGLAWLDVVDELAADSLQAIHAQVAQGEDPRPDPVLGWAVMDTRALVVRAARATSEGPRLRLPPQRARDESLRDAAADAFVRALQPGRHGDLAGIETARFHAMEALSTWPPLRVALAASSAAGLLRARLAGWDVTMERRLPVVPSDIERFFSPAMPPSLLRRKTSMRGRGLFCAALAELRRACDAAFPRLREVVGRAVTGARDVLRSAPSDRADGIYRVPPPGDGAPGVAPDVAIELGIAERADQAGLPRSLDLLLAHGALFDVALQRKASRGSIARLVRWSRARRDELDEREQWNRATALATLDDAVMAVARARKGIFIFDFRVALIETEFLLGSMHPHLPRAAGQPVHGGEVVFQPQAMRSLSRLRAILAGAWGDPGDHAELARLVVERLERGEAAGSPIASDAVRRPLDRGELVDVLVAALAGTSIVAEHHGRHEVPGARARRNELFDRALWHYPPAALIYGLDQIAQRTGAVSSTMERDALGAAVFEIHGKEAVVEAFARWCIAAHDTFGWMPSDTELLARHWGRTLDVPDRPVAP